MPNTRRRKFSVQNDIKRETSKTQNTYQTSHLDAVFNAKLNQNPTKSSRSKSKMYTNSSKTLPNFEICHNESSSSVSVKQQTATTDRHVTASSSTIDLINLMSDTNDPSSNFINEPVIVTDPTIKQINKEKTLNRRDKFPRQHRIKVRSPKRHVVLEQTKHDENTKRSIGITPVNWTQEADIYQLDALSSLPSTVEEEDRPSNHSFDDNNMCRICHGGESLSPELGSLVSACACRGTVGRVHVKCLERWLTESGKSRCELCGTRYATKRVHRYGVPRALVMWILSQNAKQLMVDSLGIMLMSPLAVLAAWLSGRTLAGLMTQETHVTPWPLASTFVLACMTLVCYYCWIVSAATRHALGWWIWYRSQYEVRLQLQQENEE